MDNFIKLVANKPEMSKVLTLFILAGKGFCKLLDSMDQEELQVMLDCVEIPDVEKEAMFQVHEIINDQKKLRRKNPKNYWFGNN